MRYLSVCSGIEAATVAWKPLGWKAVSFAEIDKFPSAVLAHHYPETRNLGDFTKIQTSDIGPIDLLVGGTPCQDFSIAGLRAGVAGERGNLTLEFLRLAQRLRPRWLVWENVPGVYSATSNDGPDHSHDGDGRWQDDANESHAFACFLAGLQELGYGFAYRTLDAQFFGVPQRRRRVFVVGHLGNWRASAAVLLEFAGLSGYPAPRKKTREDLAPCLSARTHGGGGLPPHGQGPVRGDPGLGTDFDLDGGLIQQAFGGNNASGPIDVSTAANACATASGRIDFETETFIVHSLSSEGFDASEDGTGRGVPLIAGTLSTRYGDASGRDLSNSSAILPVAFNLRGREGGAMPEVSDSASLRASAGGSTNSYIAFSAKDHGADADEIAPTLRNMGHDASHANGGGQLAIAFTLHGSDGTASIASSTDVAGSLRTRAPGSIENSSTTAVLQEQSVASLQPDSCSKQVDSSDTSSGSHDLSHAPMAVRRLTPRECERLQGFPDDYTKITAKTADGPRYKALGNSMAVPVMRWIGERIAMVESITERPKK